MTSLPFSSASVGGTTTTKPAVQTTQRTVPLYRVLIHNDDVTPMAFVVHVLTRFFKKEVTDAYEIMLEAHNKDVALVDVMGLEEAEFRVDQGHSLARTAGYPLTFSIEPQ
jgi:ATP-dependent Clp protease adaptor protein ClpS